MRKRFYRDRAAAECGLCGREIWPGEGFYQVNGGDLLPGLSGEVCGAIFCGVFQRRDCVMGKERNVPWEEILRRRKEGETARALAEEFGVSVESVYKRGQRERLEQRGSLQQAARNLCRSAGSMVAQMEDMDAKELKELTALLRELVTLEERTDKGPETVKVVLAKEAEEWSR